MSHYDTKMEEILSEITEATVKARNVATRCNYLSTFDCDLLDIHTRAARAAIAKMEGMREAKSILEFEQKERPLVPGNHSECGPDCCITGDLCDGSHTEGAEPKNQFLKGLADLVEKHGADFYYTTSDDGIHITADGARVFTGFSLTPELLRAAAGEPTHG